MAEHGAVRGHATYEDLRAVPDHLVAEIVDGDLYATPRPALRHARAASVLSVELGGPFDRGRGGPGGWWMLIEPELHLEADIVVPDLAGWRRERLPLIPAAPALAIAPDWLCEVISPATERLDRRKKLAIYARERVGYVWLVNPESRTLEILQLESVRWVVLAIHAGDETIRAAPFDAIELDLASLWSGTAPPTPDERA